MKLLASACGFVLAIFVQAAVLIVLKSEVPALGLEDNRGMGLLARCAFFNSLAFAGLIYSVLGCLEGRRE